MLGLRLPVRRPFDAVALLDWFRARAVGTELRLQEEEIASAQWFTRDELARCVASGEVVLPGRVSIARRLVEHWYGGPIDAPDNAGLR